MSLYLRAGCVVILAALAFACSSCGSAGNGSGQPEEAFNFPAPSELRTAADSYNLLTGNDYVASSFYPHNRVLNEFSETTLKFSPDSNGLDALNQCAYATFTRVVEEPGDLYWRGHWDPAAQPAAGTAYVGFANFSTDRWDWFPLADPAAELQVTPGADYTDANSRVMLAVLTTPAAGARQDLDSFSLETKSSSGWRFVELGSFESPYGEVDSYGPRSYIGGVKTLNGNPAVLFSFAEYNAGVITSHVKLAVSSTADGAEAADWTSFDVLDLDGNTCPGLCGVDGYGMFYVSYNVLDEAELHYLYATSPGGPYADSLVSTHPTFISSLRVGEIAGKPAASYGVFQDNGGSYLEPHFAMGSEAAGTTWAASRITDEKMSIVTSDGAPLVEYNGRPLIVHEGIDAPQGMYASYPGVDIPQSQADWQTVLVAGDDGNPEGVLVNGVPTYVLYQPFSGLNSFQTLRLSGSDPLTPADWSLATVDFLENPEARAPATLALGNDFGLFFLGSVSFDAGVIHPGALLHRAAQPDSDPQHWQTQPVFNYEFTNFSTDDAEAMDIESVGGQPAYARAFTSSADGTTPRSVQRVIWAHYVP